VLARLARPGSTISEGTRATSPARDPCARPNRAGGHVLIHDYVEYWAHRAPERVWHRRRSAVLTTEATRSRSVRSRPGRARRRRRGSAGGARKNCVEWADDLRRRLKAGVVPVPLNYRHHLGVIHPVTDSGATVFVTQQLYAERSGWNPGQVAQRRLLRPAGRRPPGWTGYSDLLTAARRADSAAPSRPSTSCA